MTGESSRFLPLLRAGAGVWNAWRAEQQAGVVDLRGLDLSGLNLTSANLARCNLHGATLEGASLRGADLSHADLVRGRLFDADLSKVLLRGANLRSSYAARAVFVEADLSNASLQATNLQGADLRRANLEFTTLARCDLQGARLGGAVFGGTSLSALDLSAVSGLRTAQHRRASSLAVDTLVDARYVLPPAFLRGCGLAKDVLQAAASIRLTDADRYDSVFISYSHADAAFARRLHRSLQAAGVRCWLDEREMKAGDDIYDQIERGIQEHDRILLCASESSLSSWWVDAEIEAAFAKERALLKRDGHRTTVLIPINVDGYLLGDRWQSGKRRIVQSRIAADFTHSDAFDVEVRRLQRALRKGPIPNAAA